MLNWQSIRNLRIFETLRFGRHAKIVVEDEDQSPTELSLSELVALNDISATDLAKIEGITNGTGAANKAVVLDANGGATIPGALSLDGNKLATEAGTGVTAGSGTLYQSSVSKEGGIITTRIIVDLTGLTSADSDLDVIGVEDTANPCHLGQITAAQNGTIFGGKMTCLEVPASLNDVDLYAAGDGALVYENLITDEDDEVALVTAGGAWTLGLVKAFSGVPADGQYLYLTNGASDTPDPFTAGKFLIELYGYEAA